MNDSETKWIWVIGGGIMQVPIIQEIQARGYKAIVSDQDTSAPGCKIADQVIEISTYDVDGHMYLADVMREKISGVLTAGADVGPTVSAIAEILDLPAAPYEVAINARNKLAMREIVGAEHPVYAEFSIGDSMIHTTWKRICASAGVEPYPCVIKPLESSGSRGVAVVASPWKWERATRKLRPYVGTYKRFIVEEFLSGQEYAVDFMVEDGKLYLASSAKRLFSKRFAIELGHINPWDVPVQARDIAKDVAEKLGVSSGPFKIDFIDDPRYGFTVIETATRLSGGFDHMYTCPEATGRNVTGAMLDYAIDGSFNKRDLWKTEDNVVCAYTPVLQPGIIEGWDIDQIDLVASNGFLRYYLAIKNNEIRELENCTDRPLWVFAKGNSECQAMKNAMRASRLIVPRYA